jgi:hypothetical protein
MSLHARVSWDHTWIIGTPFESIDDIILMIFAVHWSTSLPTCCKARKSPVCKPRAIARRPDGAAANAGAGDVPV